MNRYRRIARDETTLTLEEVAQLSEDEKKRIITNYPMEVQYKYKEVFNYLQIQKESVQYKRYTPFFKG